MMALTDRPRARPDVVFRQLADEWVIFDPAADRLHALNLTAALVWSFLDGARDVDGIAGEVGRAFDPPRSRADVLADVRAAVGRFAEEGLLA